VPVAVADVDPIRARHPLRSAADRVGLGGHERIDERGQHRAQQIRRRGLHLLVQKAQGRYCWGRSSSCLLRKHYERSPKNHAVAALHVCATPISGPGRYTTLVDATSPVWPVLSQRPTAHANDEVVSLLRDLLRWLGSNSARSRMATSIRGPRHAPSPLADEPYPWRSFRRLQDVRSRRRWRNT
jgi:hypothetical protein